MLEDYSAEFAELKDNLRGDIEIPLKRPEACFRDAVSFG